MSYADDLLNSIANAKKMGGRDRLAAGTHTLAVLSFTRVKNQKAGKSGPFRLQAAFEVQASDVYKPGTKATVSFFVERPEYPEYEHDRAKQFIDGCCACLSDTRGTAALGGEMMGNGQRARGIVINCQVTPDLNEDGTPKKGAKGNVYTSETWIPLAQTWEQVAEARAQLDAVHGAFQGEGPVQQTAPAPQTQTQQPPQGWGQQTQPAATQPAPAPQGGSLLRRG